MYLLLEIILIMNYIKYIFNEVLTLTVLQNRIKTLIGHISWQICTQIKYNIYISF